MNTVEGPDAHLRIGDAERAAAADRLAEHHAAGRLTVEELEERVAGAWRARTRADLARIERDLPPIVLSRAAPARTTSTADPIALPGHVSVYVAVIAMLWLIWLFTGMGHPWPIYPMLGWGAGVLRHAGVASIFGWDLTGWSCGGAAHRETRR